MLIGTPEELRRYFCCKNPDVYCKADRCIAWTNYTLRVYETQLHFPFLSKLKESVPTGKGYCGHLKQK